MTRQWPVSGVLLAVLWIFVRGVELTPVRLAEEFIIGLLVGFPLAFAVRRFYADETAVARTLRALPFALLYVVTFLK